jgi:hypothetical protein
VCALLGFFFAFRGRDARAAGAPVEPKQRLSYWEDGEPRFFAAGRIEAGLYVKPQIAVGYGQPYWINVNVEAFAISTTAFGAGYAGIRGALPFLDLRIGARYTYSYYRSFLTPKASYTADDVTLPDGPLARYLSYEAELTGVAPVLNGFIFPVITVYRIENTPAGKFVYDESLRGITDPPWIIGLRLGYAHKFGHDGFIKAGILTELILLPDRHERIWRAGPAAQVTLTDHLDVQGTLSLVLSGPDSLGIWHGPFGVLGFVYRWATGDPHPAFP